jgi:hypothetical protein
LRDDGLLLRGGRPVTPVDGNLQTYLFAEIHNHVSTAHLGRNKMRIIVERQYYWPGIMSDIDRIGKNCLTCRRPHAPHDKTPRLLRPLEIPDHPWQCTEAREVFR